MGVLRIFWCGEERSLGYLGIKLDGRLVGVCRALAMRTQFYDRRMWGEVWRGEVQDIFMDDWSGEHVGRILLKAEEMFGSRGIRVYGVSEWKPEAWRTLEELGYSVYARSVLFSWNTRREIPVGKVDGLRFTWATRRDMRHLRRIQRESWGFFIPPNPRVHRVLLAWIDGEAVGSAYLNPRTGNIDYGVHVRERFQRRGVGSSILSEALRWFRERGFGRMTVVRVLRSIYRVNPGDVKALRFYHACGGRVLREYRGFRKKSRTVGGRVPSLSEYL